MSMGQIADQSMTHTATAEKAVATLLGLGLIIRVQDDALVRYAVPSTIKTGEVSHVPLIQEQVQRNRRELEARTRSPFLQPEGETEVSAG